MLSHGRTGTRRHVWRRLAGGLALGGLLAATVFAGAQPAAGLAAGWRVVPSPNSGTGNSELYGVSCVSPSACTAVGFHGSHGAKTLAESWNGTRWSVVPSANPSSNNGFSAVSCVSASNCTAVGAADSKTLVESWNGATWSVVPSPSPSPSSALFSNILNGVSCRSASACTAVGNYAKGSFGRTLVESWNGTTWSVVPSPSPGSHHAAILYGVSCLPAGACIAVGDYLEGGTDHKTLAESWNGTTWSVAPSPDISHHDYLQGVSCASSSACTAAGYRNGPHFGKTLIESGGAG